MPGGTQALLLTLGLCCRGQQEAPPERGPYRPEGAPWRAALSEHAASNSTVGGLTGAALLKEWQKLQETAKQPRWCAARPPDLEQLAPLSNPMRWRSPEVS